MYVSIATWKKGEEKGKKILSIQQGDSISSPFEHYELDNINSSLSLFDATKAKTLVCNAKSSACYQGQTQGSTQFLLTREQAAEYLKDARNAEVLHPFLTGDELLGQYKSQPQRFVIDFRNAKDVFDVATYKELYDYIHENVYPIFEKKANDEIKKNEEAKKVNPSYKEKKDHQNAFKNWFRLFRSRNELMDIIQTINRYVVCSCVTKRPIFEFISSKINPNAALQVFPLADDYSFGILQSAIHWEWFVARCSTLTGRYRYTSDTVFDSFPWPQNPTKKQIEEVAKQAKALRDKRNEYIGEKHLTLRQLYRIMDDTPNNPISEIQIRLDNAVRDAYGMRRDADILEFLFKLNEKVYEREINGEEVQGPGLPDKIQDKSAFVTDDCVKFVE